MDFFFFSEITAYTGIPWKESYDRSRQHIKKQRYYSDNKDLSSLGYGFSSGHVWMWKLDYKESWMPKNWCFLTVVLEKSLESPLDSKENQSILKEISPEWALEWLMLKLKLQTLATWCKELTCRGPAPVDPGNSKQGRRRRGSGNNCLIKLIKDIE